MITIETLKNNAAKFANRFADASYEMGQAQSFIMEFCGIFGLDYLRAVRFEDKVKTAKGKGRIDAFFPSLLLVEMKSKGKNLDEAYSQAVDYFHGLKNEDLPRCVLVSDFENLHLYNQETKEEPLKIKLAELPQYIERFRFLTGYQKIVTERQEHINKEAAAKMAELHDAMKATGYDDAKNLETYLVRLLFCLFAEDTGLFGENGTFLNYLHNYTKPDGSDLHSALNRLFDTLNKADTKRSKNLPQHLAEFPYINGALFEGSLAECYFDESARDILIECARFDWSEISPAIFGSLFQHLMHFDDEANNSKTKKRREFGAHYTSEENILKTINPLFMDDLRAEFEKCKRNKNKLAAFHQKLATLNFFDPACGCGNFLVIAYREIRLLELEVIKAQYDKKLMSHIDIDTIILCNVHQFHGIDIDESTVQIATLALWLTDHQMNIKVQELGIYYNRIPLVKKANIICANALRIDWDDVIKPKDCSYIMGNPPFVGSTYQTKEQKADCAIIFKGMNGAGILDLVAAWHIKAARYIQSNKNIPVAFVSTNSLTQGQQVAILWTELLKLNIRLFFAHRTFQWNNEGRGVAAVHCVIMGFYCRERDNIPLRDVIPRLFNYPDIKGAPIESKVSQINPYLVDAPTVLIDKRSKPLNPNTPEMVYGNKPVDGGHLLLSPDEKNDLIAKEPKAEKWIRRLLGSQEFINGLERYCLWLVDITPNELKQMPEVLKRVEAVKNTRLTSVDEQARKLAERPTQFRDLKNPASYLLIPSVSSENRRFIPIGYFGKEVIASNLVFMLPNATLCDFGLLSSSMHNAWMRAVCGRLESRYRYSNTIVYNNFPFPNNTESKHMSLDSKIAKAAQAVLNARAEYKNSTLADLYNPLTMPPNLVKAHNDLDKAVDAAYNYKGEKEDAARVAFLFERYQQLTAPIIETEQPKPKKAKKTKQ